MTPAELTDLGIRIESKTGLYGDHREVALEVA
jgi:hypothetical protein